MSSPSFLVRLRSRARRQDDELSLELPEDHWHAGDPRMVDGSLALRTADVPSPRRSPDRRTLPSAPGRPGLTVVPQVDVRDDVVDLRRPPRTGSTTRGTTGSTTGGHARDGRAPVVPPAGDHRWSETSTWLG